MLKNYVLVIGIHELRKSYSRDGNSRLTVERRCRLTFVIVMACSDIFC